MPDFCKIFEHDEMGQVLVTIELNEHRNYVIAFTFWLDGFSVKTEVGEEETREGIQELFGELDEESTFNITRITYDKLK